MTGAPEGPPARDPYVDWLRAFSLLVVVVWHWAFTLLYWHDGPRATSPLGFLAGFWVLTWLLQVMPLFFYIGGYVHLRSWERARAAGVGVGAFVGRRLRRLAVPGAALLITWTVLGAVVGAYFELDWMGRAVRLVVSPLWFLAVYLMLVALLPVSLWLHRRFGVLLLLVWLAGAAMVVDVLRFRYDVPGVGWLNMVLVWGLAHQAGFFYEEAVAAARRNDWLLLWSGLFGLCGLVFSGLYPGAMVGVPGERFSNMAPPTFVIVALLLFQVGVVELLRPTMQRLLARPGWAAVNATINRFAMPLFLFHTTGMALSLLVFWLFGWYTLDERPADITLAWWLTRPLAITGPLLFTLPVIWLFGRRWSRPARAPRPGVAV